MISILVPVYNVENYLPDCLDSLLHQTYRDFEIVLVDDGSTDHSKYIASNYANQHENIHLYRYENAGISVTRNRLLRHAEGDYVIFVDSDDTLHPRTLEVMMHIMTKHDCDIVCCGYTMDYRFGTLLRKVETQKVMTRMEALHSLAENKGMNNYPWGKLFKKSLFDEIAFPENVRGFEDMYTIFKAICKAERIGATPRRFYHYIQHKGSLTHHMDLDTVYAMRHAYEYQQNCLRRWYPEENFHYDVHMVNNDLMILYTIFMYYTRKDNPVYIPSVIDWKRINPLVWAFYELVKSACTIRYGWGKSERSEVKKWL